MNKEALENRLIELKQLLTDVEKQHSQLIANMNAIQGAIQEVEYWLQKTRVRNLFLAYKIFWF